MFMTPEKDAELELKYNRGLLDAELMEKAKCKLGDLEWRHFRFLQTCGVEGLSILTVSGVPSKNVESSPCLAADP